MNTFKFSVMLHTNKQKKKNTAQTSTTADIKEVYLQKAVIAIVCTVVIQAFPRTTKLLRKVTIYKRWITRNIIYLDKERQKPTKS